MSSDAASLIAVRFDVQDPDGTAAFWAGLLGWRADGDTVVDPDAHVDWQLRFRRRRDRKTVQNHLHLDLTSESLADQQRTVRRALDGGAQHVDVGQRPDEPHVVLADPAGNEFCVIEPGNAFLAGCGAIGALACDGTPAAGRFWSAVLGRPLVWDQDEETAIQRPDGGPKMSWGGWPPDPRSDHVGLVVDVHDIDRVLTLGARRTADKLVMLDPDGVPFAVGR